MNNMSGQLLRAYSGANGLVPTVIDNEGRDERAYDIYSLLLKERIVLVGAAIDDQLANVTVAQLLYLTAQDATQPIQMFIHSPGGVVYSGLAIYDAMQSIPTPVHTFALGLTASMGTVLLAAGEKGHRYALAHATIHMHPAGGGAQGYTEDVRIAFRELERMQTQNFMLIAKHAGRGIQEVEKAFERDRHMQALEAKEFGLIDEVLGDTSDIVRIVDGKVEVPEK